MEPQKGERKKTAWSGLCGAGGGRAAGKSLRLPTPVCTQMAIKSVQFLDREAWSKDLLEALTKPDRTHQEQPPEKVAPSPPAAHGQARALSLGRTSRARPGPLEETGGTGAGSKAGSHTLGALPPGRGWMVHPQADEGQEGQGARTGEGLVPRVDREGGGPAQDWTPDPPPGLPVHLLRAGPASRGERHHGQDTPEEPPGDVAPVAQAEGGEAPAPPIPHPPAPTTA